MARKTWTARSEQAGVLCSRMDLLEQRRMLAVGDYQRLITFGQREEVDTGWQVVTDVVGNTYVAGTFEGRIDVDPAKDRLKRLYSPKSDSIFIAKYSPDRRLLWGRRVGGEGNDEVSVMRLTPEGDIVLAGQYDERADFGGRNNPLVLQGNGDREIYIAKLDGGNGRTIWASSIGGGNDDFVTSVNVGLDGDVYYGGTIRLKGDVDPGPRLRLITTVGTDDTIISRLDGGTGALKWFRVFGEDDTRETVRGIEVDAQGRAIVFGLFNRELQFDRNNASFTREADGEDDVYIARVRGNGRLDWVKHFGGNEFETVADVAVGPDGSIHVTGLFQEEVDFDPNNGVTRLEALSENDTYIAKFRPNGSLVWARQLGGEDVLMQAKGIAVDNSGAVYATGEFNADDLTGLVVRRSGRTIAVLTTDKDDAPRVLRSFRGAPEVYMVRLNAAGQFTHAIQFGGEDGSPIVNDISVGAGSVWLTGSFTGEDGTDFDPGPRQLLRKTSDERGEADLYLLRLEA